MNRVNLLALAAVIGCAGTGSQRLETPAPIPDDEVSVGYGTQLKQNTTGAVSSFTPTERDAHVARVEEMLLARVPGLEVVRLAGGSYTLRIRGPSSFGGIIAGGEPLLVVDVAPVLLGAYRHEPSA